MFAALAVAGLVAVVAIIIAFYSSASQAPTSVAAAPSIAGDSSKLPGTIVEKPVNGSVNHYINRTIEKPIYINRTVEVVKTVPAPTSQAPLPASAPATSTASAPPPSGPANASAANKTSADNPPANQSSNSSPSPDPASPSASPSDGTPPGDKAQTQANNDSQDPGQGEGSQVKVHLGAPAVIYKEFQGDVKSITIPPPVHEKKTHDEYAKPDKQKKEDKKGN